MGTMCLEHSWVLGTFLGFCGPGALEHSWSLHLRPLWRRSPGGCQHLLPGPDPLPPPGTCSH